MGMNKCSFSGVCVRAPKQYRSQDGVPYATFSLAVKAGVRNDHTHAYEEQCSMVEFALFGEKRVRALMSAAKQGTRMAILCYYRPVEIRDNRGKLKSIPIFVVEEWEMFGNGDEKWHSPEWF